MGCDIHLYTEYKKDGKWNPGDAWKQAEDGVLEIPYHLQPYNNRNYQFFAWLADVRNGTWGDTIPVISEPKGLPKDCSELIKKHSANWGEDGHSHSYFTLPELEEAYKKSKEQLIHFQAVPMLSEEALQEWLKTPEKDRRAPKGYSAGSWSGGKSQPSYGWYEPLSELINYAYNSVKEYLWKLSIEYNVPKEDVRTVFWFDN